MRKLLKEYVSVRLVGRSGRTAALMAVAVEAFAKWLGRQPQLADLTDSNIAAFATARLKSGKSIATVQQNQLKLLALWRFACQTGLIKTWPRIKPLRVPERTPQAWTQQELTQLFAAIAEVPGQIGDVPASLWWETLHRLLWNTGERVSAILELRWQHVSLDELSVLVPAELRKGKTRDRTYRLGPDTVDCLRRFPSRQGIVLAWPLNRQYIYSRYRAVLASAGLPTDRRSMFHRLRRSVASHIKAAGGDAMEAMDHASIRTTQGYLDPRIVPKVSPVDLLFTP